MPEYTPKYVGGSLIKNAVKDIKVCKKCGGLPEFGQSTKDDLAQSYIKCTSCDILLEDNIPLNQLVFFWNRDNQ